MSKAERIVQTILGELEGRKGFDWWWDDLDALVQSEIEQALVGEVQYILEDANA